MNLSPIALAQALIFDLKLGQKQVIGEWIPLSEPGVSEIIRKKRKWIPGLQWSQIDSDLNLRLRVGDQIKEINLKRGHGMVMAELNRLTEIPKDGPMIVFEKKRKRFPYTPEQFRAQWRIVATAAGVPKSIRNVHHQIRDPQGSGKIHTGKEGNSDERRAPVVDNSEIWDFVRALCKALPDDIRDDIAQEMALDTVDGKVNLDELRGMMSDYVTQYHKGYDNRFVVRSLDEHHPTTGERLGDTIQSDHQIWK